MYWPNRKIKYVLCVHACKPRAHTCWILRDENSHLAHALVRLHVPSEMIMQIEQFSRLLFFDCVDVLKFYVRHSNVDQLQHGSGGGVTPFHLPPSPPSHPSPKKETNRETDRETNRWTNWWCCEGYVCVCDVSAVCGAWCVGRAVWRGVAVWCVVWCGVAWRSVRKKIPGGLILRKYPR